MAKHTVCLYLALMILMFTAARADSRRRPPAPHRTVEGVAAIIQRNQAQARRSALHEGLRRAVEQTVTDLLDSPVSVASQQVLESQLYTEAPRYIQSYRVLWEYPHVAHRVYRVSLEVEVDVPALTLQLARLGLTPSGDAPLRILVLLEKHQPSRTQVLSGERVKNLMTDALRAKFQAQQVRVVGRDGALPWDGQATSALALGKAARADLLLMGWVNVQMIRCGVAGLPIDTVQALIQVEMWATATRERLAREQTQATVVHTDTILAGMYAIKQAAAALVLRLDPIIQAYHRVHGEQRRTRFDRRAMPLQ
jgi:hypothetical protein